MKKKPDWSKIGRSSRNKGARYERQIAKIFNEALGTNLRRTPQSGGMELKGDLVDLGNPDFPFHIECKDRMKQVNFARMLCSGEGKPLEWLTEATENCPKNKIPFVVFKGGIGYNFVIIRSALVNQASVFCPHFASFDTGMPSLSYLVFSLRSFIGVVINEQIKIKGYEGGDDES